MLESEKVEALKVKMDGLFARVADPMSNDERTAYNLGRADGISSFAHFLSDVSGEDDAATVIAGLAFKFLRVIADIESAAQSAEVKDEDATVADECTCEFVRNEWGETEQKPGVNCSCEVCGCSESGRHASWK